MFHVSHPDNTSIYDQSVPGTPSERRIPAVLSPITQVQQGFLSEASLWTSQSTPLNRLNNRYILLNKRITIGFIMFIAIKNIISTVLEVTFLTKNHVLVVEFELSFQMLCTWIKSWQNEIYDKMIYPKNFF